MLEHDRWRSPSAEALARSCEGEIEDPWFYDYESMVRRTYNLTARLAANSEAMASAPEGVDICRLVAIARLSEGDELLLDYGRCASA